MASKHKYRFSFMRFLSCLGSAWLIVTGFFAATIPELVTNLVAFDLAEFIVYAFLISVIFLIIFLIDAKRHDKKIAPYCFIISLLFFSLVLCVKSSNLSTYIFMSVVLMLALYCFNEKYKPSFLHKDFKKPAVITSISVVTVFVFACVLTISVLRYKTYSAPNYDFGIFCNMFYNMKKTGLPISSCERDKVLSHFAVHISPVFYLLLPVYFVFSSPITLAVLQPLIIFSSVIPLYLLAKHFKISSNAVAYILIAFALFAPLSTGCFYDLHENCFLVPLLIWVFYFFEKNKKIPLFIFVMLVLLVKEDAFIYIAFFAVYVIISRKKYALGSSLLVLAGAYFVLASYLLTKYGLGIMESRYVYLSGSDGGLIDAMKTILLNPGYAIGQVLETRDGDLGKIHYIAALFFPLLFIPFMNKDFTRLILILPIFINLLTKYPYQYNIVYQYTFGICAFLFYMTLLNLSEMQKEKQNSLSFAAIFMSLILFSSLVIPKAVNYIIKYDENKEINYQIAEALETIPKDAEVTSSTYFLPHLANRDIIYEDEYHDKPSTEYFVLDLRQPKGKERRAMYTDSGYELIYSVSDALEIYRLSGQ